METRYVELEYSFEFESERDAHLGRRAVNSAPWRSLPASHATFGRPTHTATQVVRVSAALPLDIEGIEAVPNRLQGIVDPVGVCREVLRDRCIVGHCERGERGDRGDPDHAPAENSNPSQGQSGFREPPVFSRSWPTTRTTVVRSHHLAFQ